MLRKKKMICFFINKKIRDNEIVQLKRIKPGFGASVFIILVNRQTPLLYTCSDKEHGFNAEIIFC